MHTAFQAGINRDLRGIVIFSERPAVWAITISRKYARRSPGVCVRSSQSQQAMATNFVALYKALGGSWQVLPQGT